MLISDIFESKKNKATKEIATEPLPQPQLTYNIKSDTAFDKMVLRYNSHPKLKLLRSLLDVLNKEGKIETNNVHRIKQPIFSSMLQKEVTGWYSVWISSSDDLRLLYRKDGQYIEVKFGKAKDVGYSH